MTPTLKRVRRSTSGVKPKPEKSSGQSDAELARVGFKAWQEKRRREGGMSTQPALLDVPRNKVPGRAIGRRDLSAFKRTHQIETHNARHLAREACPWMATHLPSCWRIGKVYGVKQGDDAATCALRIGRLMDDAGIATYGRTEREAIEELCRNLGLDFTA